jgi:hypothetical protein
VAKVVIVEHARERAHERGASEQEIRQTLKAGDEIKAKKGRKAKEKVFVYNKKWLGKEYPQKKVQVIYIEENEGLVVITVKAFYGEWG